MITKTTIETVTKNYATFEDLERFLKERNILKCYIINLITNRGEEIVGLDLKEFLKAGLFSRSFISGAFDWENSQEGYDFWRKKSKEFNEWCDQNNIVGFIDE